MIDAASFIGFALAMLTCSWACSLVFGAAFFTLAPRLRRRGPELERRAAATALVLPAFVGVAVVAALVARSLAIPVLGVDDHCPAHVHHLHLCLFHGSGWTEHVAAVIAVTGVGTYVAVRLLQIAAAHVSTARSLRQLRRSATPVVTSGGEVLVAPSRRVFLFVAGIVRPRVYISSEAWSALADDERDAALAHERAHARQGDLLWRAVYGLCGLVAAPLISRPLLRRWTSATEQSCDRQAAWAAGSAEPVARALLALARRSSPGAVPATVAAFVPPGTELALRVESLLRGEPFPPPARGWTRPGMALAAILGATLALADPLHHALETVLGIF